MALSGIGNKLSHLNLNMFDEQNEMKERMDEWKMDYRKAVDEQRKAAEDAKREMNIPDWRGFATDNTVDPPWDTRQVPMIPDYQDVTIPADELSGTVTLKSEELENLKKAVKYLLFLLQANGVITDKEVDHLKKVLNKDSD